MATVQAKNRKDSFITSLYQSRTGLIFLWLLAVSYSLLMAAASIFVSVDIMSNDNVGFQGMILPLIVVLLDVLFNAIWGGFKFIRNFIKDNINADKNTVLKNVRSMWLKTMILPIYMVITSTFIFIVPLTFSNLVFPELPFETRRFVIFAIIGVYILLKSFEKILKFDK